MVLLGPPIFLSVKIGMCCIMLKEFLYIYLSRYLRVLLLNLFVVSTLFSLTASAQVRIKEIYQAPGQQVTIRGVTIQYSAGAVGNAVLSYQSRFLNDAYVNQTLVANTDPATSAPLNWNSATGTSTIPVVPTTGPFGVVPNPPSGPNRPLIKDYTWHRLSFSTPVTISESQNFFVGDVDNHELGTVIAYDAGGRYTYGSNRYNTYVHNGSVVGSALQQHSAFQFDVITDHPNDPGQNDARYLTMGQSSGNGSGVTDHNNYMTLSLQNHVVKDIVYYHTWRQGAGSRGYIMQSPDFSVLLAASLQNIRSQVVGNKLKLRFTTASEEGNVGFQVYGVDAQGEHHPVGEMIPSKVISKNTGTRYSHKLDYDGSFDQFYIATVDTSGKEELYGAYEVGKKYGRDEVGPKFVDWDLIKGKLQDAGFARVNGRFVSGKSALGVAANQRLQTRYERKLARFKNKPMRVKGLAAQVSVPASKPGFYRVSVQELSDAGVDLEGKSQNQVGVLFNGVPVSRVIEGSQKNALLNQDSAILFYHNGLSAELKRYNSEAVYEIVRDRRAVVASSLPSTGVGADIADSYEATTSLDLDQYYDPALPNDGWYMKRLLRRGNRNTAATFTLEADALNSSEGKVKVNLVGVTDWPSENDHHARVYLNDELIADELFDGLAEHSIVVEAGSVVPGANTVKVELIADTGQRFDVVNVDSVALAYDRPFVGNGSQLAFTSEASSFSVSDVDSTGGVLAKVEGDPILYTPAALATGDGDVLFAAPKSGVKTAYCVGNPTSVLSVRAKESLHKKKLGKTRADLVVLSHRYFINNPSLAKFVSAKRASGYRTKIIDIEDVFNQYGFGHRSVSAIQTFLSKVRGLEAVLVVGRDTVDYHGNLGESISFVPTAYTRTETFNHVPNDGLLTDIDGDGWSDVAVGRWPVSTDAELELIVDRSLSYEQQLAGGSLEALALSEKSYGGYGFLAGKLFSKVADNVSLLGVDGIIQELYPAPLEGDANDNFEQEEEYQVALSAEQEAISLLRTRFRDALLSGLDILSYGGHASADRWGYRTALLTAGEIDTLEFDRPIGLLMLACYTTDFVNPDENTFVYQWLFGSGDVVNGAAFIAGATSLSSDIGNLVMVEGAVSEKNVPIAELLRREAVAQKGVNSSEDTAKTWNFIGDPTLKWSR